MSGRLDWNVAGREWPQREASRFVSTPGLTWRVVRSGAGPAILLLHGTGASAHSWRGLVPLLERDFTVIAPDLPGHGFTTGRPPRGATLPGMASALADLLAALDIAPALMVGHSAGVAIALQHAHLTGSRVPILGFNPALMPFPGAAARLFPALAKILFVNPIVPRIFARMARMPGETERFLVRATGSHIEPEGQRCYRVLLGNSGHCEGALEMMARWDLAALAAKLPSIANPVALMHSRGDLAIPRDPVEEAARLLPNGTLTIDSTLGHLAHEEDSPWAAAHIRCFARENAISHTVETSP